MDEEVFIFKSNKGNQKGSGPGLNMIMGKGAKKAYAVLERAGKLPYPNANLDKKTRKKYFNSQEMAEELGISVSRYQQIKPLVDILFEAGYEVAGIISRFFVPNGLQSLFLKVFRWCKSLSPFEVLLSRLR